MSSRNMTGRAQAPSVFDRANIRVWMLVITALTAVALVIVNPGVAHAAANPCEGTQGVECLIPNEIDWSIMGFAARPITWILNAFMVAASVYSLFILATKGITFLRALRAGNAGDAKKEGIHALVCLIILVLCSTGVFFTILTGAISTIQTDLS